MTDTMQLRNRIRENMNIDLTWSFTGNPILIKMWIKEGRETFPKKILQLNRIKNIRKHVNQSNFKNKIFYIYGITAYKYLNSLLTFKKILHENKKIEIKIISKFDEKINIFWNEVKLNYNFITEKNEQYLNWRYMDPRAGKYVVMIAMESEEILGYCVTRINRINPDYPEGYIVEFLCLPSRDDVANRLLDKALDYFDENNINNVKTWSVQGHPYVKMFSSRGFFKSNAEVFIDFQNKKIDKEWSLFQKSKGENLFFQLGDTDTI